MEYISLSWYDIPELVFPIRISLRGLLLTRKLLNQEFLLVRLKSSLQKFYGRHNDLCNICVTNDHRYVPLVASTSRSFPHSWLITRFVNRVTQWVPLMEQGTAYPSGAPEFTPGFYARMLIIIYQYFKFEVIQRKWRNCDHLKKCLCNCHIKQVLN